MAENRASTCSVQRPAADGIGMDPHEGSTQSFIIRISLEEPTRDSDSATWHGQIVHVPDPEPHYFRKLGDIADYMAPYLEAMRVDLGLRRELTRRLRGWTRRWRRRS